jgi:membrane protein required for colicin V production
MHAYDIIMIVILAAATLFGLWKGFAWQVASLASLVVSYFVALRFSGDLATAFGWTENWERFAAMLILYLACSFLIWMAFRFVSNIIDKVRLKAFDKQIGGLFGFAKGVLYCTVVTFFVVTLSADGRTTVLQSQSGYYIAKVLDKAHAAMPEELHEVLHPYIHRLEQELAADPSRIAPEPEHRTRLFPAHKENERTPVDRFLDRLLGAAKPADESTTLR